MKKILKLLIGTNNKGKYKEIKDLLPKYIKTHSTSEFKLKSPKEDGLTFRENSIIKAKHFSKRTKLICLADDSGLEIDILEKSPGIYSARWGGKKADFKRAINRVYRELSKKDKNWKYKKVKARFICALSICYLDKKTASVLGKVEGFISTEPKGNNGFGYDPIFIPKNKKKTFGEMSSSQKYKIDHRFAAFQKIKRFL
jgi:XTP/dITP diphosphohydrolase